ncbi:hypothetical protein HMPREF0578_1645 [Mobiluncus mulieris 28-1]|uniref:Uncharacterized protein n=2 Tax=Mobiluncus mulieris TaxID=2052 RepID=E0QMU4_9ACTO|nr:hypothetical protein [Mobiluncus mulieris]EEZ92358.1 hypothetical protein HMPREF0578_1645 [Mobiluncus mulieris 28-1]EFM47111.1 hypothetical protein HMPREF0580_0208 [Mobiluncus mulieris ATCC 35239]MCU9971177.1 hypothetical protein [Mobiluncus mulieris]MCU9975780.1 hypothetical protein [Mobiluncus mulieris]MCU9993998.1 hypothetical protein [Mobiluncus mulieris]
MSMALITLVHTGLGNEGQLSFHAKRGAVPLAEIKMWDGIEEDKHVWMSPFVVAIPGVSELVVEPLPDTLHFAYQNGKAFTFSTFGLPDNYEEITEHIKRLLARERQYVLRAHKQLPATTVWPNGHESRYIPAYYADVIRENDKIQVRIKAHKAMSPLVQLRLPDASEIVYYLDSILYLRVKCRCGHKYTYPLEPYMQWMKDREGQEYEIQQNIQEPLP